MFLQLEKQIQAAFRESLSIRFGVDSEVVIEQPKQASFGDVATREGDVYPTPMPDYFTVSVQDVVRLALSAVARDRARIIPGTALNLTMSIVAFLPMFVKRLFLNAQVARKRIASKASPPMDYEISGMV